MNSRFNDLILATVIAALALLAALAGVDNLVLRVALGSLLALILPGYAVMAALFPRRALTPGEQALFALSLSLAASALGGLVLNVFPNGLRVQGWATYLAALTWSGALVAYYRRRRLPLPSQREGLTRPAGSVPWLQAALLGLALVAVGLSVGVARVGALAQPGPDFTQLWMIPVSETDHSVLRVGIHNQEAAPASYRLELVSGDRVLGEWSAIALKPGESWEIMPVLPKDLPAAEPVRALLYRADKPDVVYRQGVFWPDAS